jgi:hypothetical protein
MPLIPMRALVPFLLEGRAVSTGDRLEVSPSTAASLHYQHKADFVTVPLVPEPVRKRRTYKRRDLQAEA